MEIRICNGEHCSRSPENKSADILEQAATHYVLREAVEKCIIDGRHCTIQLIEGCMGRCGGPATAQITYCGETTTLKCENIGVLSRAVEENLERELEAC